MRIIIDLQSLQTASRERGIGRYSLALARAMIAEGGRHDWFVAMNHAFPDTVDDVRESLATFLPQENILLFQVPTPVAGGNPENHWRCRSAELVREQFLQQLQPDWAHVSSLFEGLGDNAVTSVNALPGVPTAVTLYDLIPYLNPERYLSDQMYKSWYLRKMAYLRQADLLLAISESSRQEVMNALGISGDRVVNVFADADASFRIIDLDQATRDRLAVQYRLHREFVMYACSIDYHKNMERLIEAYAQLADEVRSAHQLVIVCNVRGDGRRLFKLAAGLGLGPDELVFTGYVSDEDLVALYNMCKVFVFPSLHEGFGLPALEAMRCGVPVIGSNSTSLPEVIGLEEALFDPLLIDSIKEKLFQVLTDDDFRQRLRRHGSVQAGKFSWQASARRALDAMEAAYDQRQSDKRLSSVSIPVVKPRLAYVSPLPPEKSAIATYSAELLPDLAHYYDIDLITDLSATSDPWLAEHFRLRKVAEFKDSAREYDRILYHFGNSAFHSQMFGLLARYPGTVVLHDSFLSGVLHIEADADGSPAFRQAAYRSHGYPALWYWRIHGAESAVDAYPASLEVLQGAQGVIVHSDDCLHLAARWFGRETQGRLVMIPQLDPAVVGAMYAQAIESFAGRHPVASRRRLLQAIRDLSNGTIPPNRDLAQTAAAIAENIPPLGKSKVLVDISELVNRDAKTGIQRVVWSILREMTQYEANYRAEPVYRSGSLYRYGWQFMEALIGIGQFGLDDAPVDVARGDLFLGLDLDAERDEAAVHWLQHQARRGVRLYFVVYDLLPLLKSEMFPGELVLKFRAWLATIAGLADGLICISRSVAMELGQWLNEHPVERRRPLSIGYFHLGSEIVTTSTGGAGLSESEQALLGRLSNETFILMVGTIEPRKGHSQALDAFETLWRQGENVLLVIVGKQGWLMDRLMERLHRHPEAARRLFWLDRASDNLLDELYRKAAALLIASEGEGFGLPLVEAARQGLPVIARDLPVFQEIAGDSVFYFHGTEADVLGRSLKEWLDLYRQGRHPRSEGIRCLNWQESARQLEQVLFDDRWFATWEPGGGFRLCSGESDDADYSKDALLP
jgi:glycosyltransferase involved in cell wall biosynthesis